MSSKVFYMPISPASLGIILDLSHTKILLVQRKDIPVWVLPGGGIDREETAEKAVIREIAEETGYKVIIQRQCAHYYPINKLSSVTSIFICSIVSGSSLLSEETNAVDFFSLDKLPSTLFPPHKKWILEGLNSSSTIFRSLDEINYWSCFTLFMAHPHWIIRYLWTRWNNKN